MRFVIRLHLGFPLHQVFDGDADFVLAAEHGAEHFFLAMCSRLPV
jgi:hypothetical protein